MANYEDQLQVAMAAQIRVELAERGMDQKDLAEAVGIHPVTMTKYMKGQRVPNMATFYKIAAALGLSPYELMQRSEDRSAQ